MPKTSQKAAIKPAAVKAPAKGDHVFLVDGSSYIFRAYHALPPLNRKSDGLQVNAVLGFCNMLWKLLREMPPDNQPTHLAIVFDKSEVTFRNKLYPDYKAHRPPAPDDLIPQFAFIREAVRAFDLPCLEQAGYEADDLIATYVREACEASATAIIVASDKDLMQLVRDCVVMYDSMKDKRIGVPEVMEKFGVPPEKVIEVQALIGDSTDNVPGVPGIGVKTAAQLICEYGDLETLLARAGEIKQQKRRETLIDNAENARLSKKLVTLDDKVKLDVPIEDLAVHEPDYKLLIAFLRAMEFSTLVRRVAEFSGIDASQIEPDETMRGGSSSLSHAARAAIPPSPLQAPSPGLALSPSLPLRGGSMPIPQRSGAQAPQPSINPQALANARLEAARKSKVDRARYEIVRTLPRLQEWIARAIDLGTIAIDTQTSSIDPMQATLCGIALALGPNEACYVPLAHRESSDGNGGGLFGGGLAPDQLSEGEALDALKPLLEDESILKIGQNAKFDWLIFAQRGIEVAPYDDTMLISYVLDAGRSGHELEQLATRYFDHTAIDHAALIGSGKSRISFDCVVVDKAAEYAAERADLILRLWHVLKPP